MTTPPDLLWELMFRHLILREAEASIALDGETQSVPEPNAYAYVLMPDGELRQIRIYDQASENAARSAGWRKVTW